MQQPSVHIISQEMLHCADGHEPHDIALSPIDNVQPALYISLAFYYHNSVPAEILRESLVAILGKYHPSTGRLAENDKGRWSIQCHNQGVLFLTGSTTMTIAEVLAGPRELIYNNITISNEIAPTLPIGGEHAGQPITAAQVTYFACGGMCIGFKISHKVVDGRAAFDMIKAWAAAAATRTASRLSGVNVDPPAQPIQNDPIHSRELLTPEKKTSAEPSPSMPKMTLEALPSKCDYRLFHISKDALRALKQEASIGMLPTDEFISTNDAVTALLMNVLTKARSVDPSAEVNVRYAVDWRTRTNPPLPVGYWCNSSIAACATVPAHEITDEGKFQASCKLIRRTTTGMNDEFLRNALTWLDSFDTMASWVSPIQKIVLGPDIQITNWSGFGMYGIDFGSGAPEFAGSTNTYFMGFTIITSSKEEDGSIDIMLGLLPHHMHAVDADPFLRTYAPKLH